MKLILAIGTGSFIGGILRYLISQFMVARFPSAFPYGTFSVNVIGCFFIGLVFGLADRGSLPSEWKLFLATGLLGGFTTFSAFSNETVVLLRDGQVGYAIAYVASSVLLGILATFVGIILVR
jgi:fluoride exporter